MTILDLADAVERGDYASDRTRVQDLYVVNGRDVLLTYTLRDAMQHAQVIMMREESITNG